MASNRKVADGGTGQSAGPTERLDAVLFGGSFVLGREFVTIKPAAAVRSRARGAPVDDADAKYAAAAARLYKDVLPAAEIVGRANTCLLYTSPSPRD